MPVFAVGPTKEEKLFLLRDFPFPVFSLMRLRFDLCLLSLPHIRPLLRKTRYNPRRIMSIMKSEETATTVHFKDTPMVPETTTPAARLITVKIGREKRWRMEVVARNSKRRGYTDNTRAFGSTGGIDKKQNLFRASTHHLPKASFSLSLVLIFGLLGIVACVDGKDTKDLLEQDHSLEASVELVLRNISDGVQDLRSRPSYVPEAEKDSSYYLKTTGLYIVDFVVNILAGAAVEVVRYLCTRNRAGGFSWLRSFPSLR